MVEPIDSLIKIKNDYMSKKDVLIKKHPQWNQKEDTRICLFSKCINVMNSCQLGLNYLHTDLSRIDWWRNNATNISEEDIRKYLGEFDMFLKLGLLQFIFSSLESSMRLILKSVDSSVCNQGADNFDNICCALLKRTGLQTHFDLIEFFKLVRNTLHNNGVYFPNNPKDKSISYKGKNYFFQVGKKIDFVTWELLISLVSDIGVLSYDLTETKKVVSVLHIADPSS